jgi:hypothetical protein
MKKITLVGGYADGKTTHKDVELGKRLLGADLFAIDENPLSNLPSNHEFLILSRAITKFGGLRLPVPLTVLLSLDSIDRDDLLEAYNQLEAEGAEGREAEILSDSKVRLADGVEIEEVRYDVVQFGNRIRGYDYAEADKQQLVGARKAFFLVGRQVSRLSQSDGEAALDGPLDLATLEKFYARDLYAMRSASELWRQSFRRPSKGVQGKRVEKDSVPADGADGQAGK